MSKPVSVFDVAQYILDQRGRMTTWKLQKLVYYSQAWSLVWDDGPLFNERIEAWANGPVVPALYEKHRGYFTVTQVGGDPSRLDRDQRETIDAVLREYGAKRSHWLADLTHREEPWRMARQRAGLTVGVRGNAKIMPGDMADYYSNL